MSNPVFSFRGSLEHIDEPGGWWYMELPAEIRDSLKPFMRHGGGLKVTATVGNTTWQTAVMPLRRGVSMIAIKSNIRKAENIQLGQAVTVSLTPVNT